FKSCPRNQTKRPAWLNAGGPFAFRSLRTEIRTHQPPQTKPTKPQKTKSEPQNKIKKTVARVQVGGPLPIRITAESIHPVQDPQKGAADARDKSNQRRPWGRGSRSMAAKHETGWPVGL
ncbi:hypothetical protein LB554_29380, partial [Mesorhizobium sp. CO1-1-11]|uniref:hypothetical protein n=1 Tax=Mesorhizobium sp. CO1-1-11 TaxID=2876636 RepID=UPI001CCBAF25